MKWYLVETIKDGKVVNEIVKASSVEEAEAQLNA